MKRIPKYRTYSHAIKSFKRRFKWTECDLCRKEIRNEKMWKIRMWTKYFNTEFNVWAHEWGTNCFCKDCCPTTKAIIELYEKLNKEKNNDL